MRNIDLEKCCICSPGDRQTDRYRNAPTHTLDIIVQTRRATGIHLQNSQTVAYVSYRILYSNEKEQISAAHNNVGNLHNGEQKKEDTKDHIGLTSTYRNSKSGKVNYIVHKPNWSCQVKQGNNYHKSLQGIYLEGCDPGSQTWGGERECYIFWSGYEYDTHSLISYT